MPRVKKGVTARRRHKKILRLAKGYRGSQSRRFRSAIEAVIKAGRHAYTGRKLKKREYRGIWIQRINAASRLNGLPYNRLMYGLKTAGVILDRKVLADMAMHEPEAFSAIAQLARKHCG
ncbi:50S ribosomal protein L20 [bacterium]|nr:50S ribosomal protein L20 [candidate division CSSED10-310 bacterium]